MDEKQISVEASQSAALEASDMRDSCENACSLHTSSREAKEVSMPICFLVKEQAKSMVAIQELQKRVENVEGVQDDVIESLIEIKNFLCGESRINNLSVGTPSFTSSPNVLKSSPFTKTRRFTYSPSNLKSSLESSSLSVRSKSVSPRYSEQLVSELRKPLPCASIQASQKLFDLAKNKDSVLESDKQDSGLDSDCREQNDIHHSLGKNWGKQETNDELLQLLDEITERSEILQKQLFVVEENVVQDIVNQEVVIENREQMESKFIPKDTPRSKPDIRASATNDTEREKSECSKKLPSNLAHVESVVPMKNTFADSSVLFERKPICERASKMRKTTSNKIDSAMVSLVLKETNVIELQRQVLIYLVENAVLQTKLGESEQCLYNKTLESEKVENSLKDEARLLMMENRELRIGLDEQKCEIGSLKSKVAMLERVLQSVTVENRELNWQLGESLGLQNLSRREPHNLSSSFTFGSSNSKSFRRSSLPHQFSSAAERHAPCTKSKLLPSASSCLDATVEESDQGWQQLGSASYKFKDGPALSSTPLMPHAKLKDSKKHFLNAPNLPFSGNQTQTNFQTVKKHLKCNSEKDSVSSTLQMCLEENASQSRTKANGTIEDMGAAKFPFNTILEKLKANSDYRISRRVPGTLNETLACSSTDQTKASSSSIRNNHLSPPCRETSCSETKITTRNSVPEDVQDNKSNTRKGRNIHQRIQDILDRIMAESEETT